VAGPLALALWRRRVTRATSTTGAGNAGGHTVNSVHIEHCGHIPQWHKTATVPLLAALASSRQKRRASLL
jgi:hypothetical protein